MKHSFVTVFVTCLCLLITVSPQCAENRNRRCYPNLNAPLNGYIVGRCDNRLGSVCKFQCRSGYVMNGSPVLRCNTRKERWEPRPPICVASNRYNAPTCYALDAPINGRKFGMCSEGALAGSVCSFDCRVGYALSGQSSLVCQVDGTWGAEPPQCNALSDRLDGACSRLAVPFRGNMTGDCSPGIQGRRCSFYCYPGYVLVGYKTLYCTVDGWSSNVPTCRDVTCKQGNRC